MVLVGEFPIQLAAESGITIEAQVLVEIDRSTFCAALNIPEGLE